MTRPRVLFVSGSGSGNTLRYRVRMAEEHLRASGFSTAAVHFTDPQLRGWAEDADALVLYRTPASRRVLRLIEHARTKLEIPIAFDIDDRVFLEEHIRSVPFLDDLRPSQRALFERDVLRRGRAVPFVDMATGTTQPVVTDLSTLTAAPTRVLPNGVTHTALRLADAAREGRHRSGRVRLGYFSGSATHDEDWRVVEPVILDLLRRHPTAELWLVGPLRPGEELAALEDRIVRVPAVPWPELPALLAAVDINLAPLELTPFTEGKSAIKWMEAALVETPTVATSTQPFREATMDGEDVRLAATAEDWASALEDLVSDSALRSELGRRARESALAGFSPQLQVERYREALDALLVGERQPVPLAAIRDAIVAAGPVRTLGVGLETHPLLVSEPAAGWMVPGGAAALESGRRVVRTGRRSVARAARARRTAQRRLRRGLGAARRRLLPRSTDTPPPDDLPTDHPNG